MDPRLTRPTRLTDPRVVASSCLLACPLALSTSVLAGHSHASPPVSDCAPPLLVLAASCDWLLLQIPPSVSLSSLPQGKVCTPEPECIRHLAPGPVLSLPE